MSEVIKVSRFVVDTYGVPKALGYISWLSDSNIPCGKTTAYVLGLVQQAISSPEIPVKISPEHSHQTTQQILAQGGLLSKVKGVVEKLGLDYLEVNGKDLTITYFPYVYFKKDWQIIGTKQGD